MFKKCFNGFSIDELKEDQKMSDAVDELKEIKVRHRGEGGWYTREDLMSMEPVCLRALFRERA